MLLLQTKISKNYWYVITTDKISKNYWYVITTDKNK
jgi:hypothetical protein